MTRSGAEVAKADGMAASARGANPEWLEEAFGVVIQVAERRQYFTTDAVMAVVNQQCKHTTHDLRAMGPVMQRAAREELVKKANLLPINSVRRSLHACPKTVWESLIWHGNDGA